MDKILGTIELATIASLGLATGCHYAVDDPNERLPSLPSGVVRNLVVYCDGTGNTPEQEDNGKPTPTNVYKMRTAVVETTVDDKIQQAPLYLVGVGANLLDAKGKIAGHGVSEKIMTAYTWLGRNYRPGDRIYLFGFSRGAFTVRSLVGFINDCGLLNLSGLSDDEVKKRVETAYQAYGQRRYGREWAGDWKFHKQDAASANVRIQFLGVWDTVAALDVPGLHSEAVNALHDISLPDIVVTARHAVAIDEIRYSFAPSLWLDKSGRPYQGTCDLGGGRTVSQLWFPGVHSNVGGSYENAQLSDCALKWMADEAAADGLCLDRSAWHLDPNGNGPMRNSVVDECKEFETMPRNIPPLDPGSKAFHSSVFERIEYGDILQSRFCVAHKGYRRPLRPELNGAPISVPIKSDMEWNCTDIYLEQNATYEFTAKGTWLDGYVFQAECNPDGVIPVKELVVRGMRPQVVGEARNELTQCALIGFIADQGNPDLDGTYGKDRTFWVIGRGPKPRKPEKSGYLYCFVNGHWGSYWNNRGELTLSVQRIK